jgi:hypothetical protein
MVMDNYQDLEDTCMMDIGNLIYNMDKQKKEKNPWFMNSVQFKIHLLISGKHYLGIKV